MGPLSGPAAAAAGWATCAHEAGHAVAAAAAGWPPLAASVRGGRALAGCTVYRRPRLPGPPPDVAEPYLLWPPEWRSWVDRSALIAAAGDAAEHLFAAAPGRGQATAAERARDAACPPAAADGPPGEQALPAAQRDALRRALEDPGDVAGDAEYLARLATAAHGEDVLAAGHWLAWVAEAARAVLAARAAEVLRVAGLLAAAGELSGEAIAACLGPGGPP